ncbi:MAG: ATP-binding cassette domain-containing protein [Marinobacter sp.]|uniref:phosphonate ABC transporter ATP-binding protein n=1 Tax=Marinobacter sp. TaxID=50741 RepID=UPI00299D1A9E|nr:ATP-binding cassette domain-containing protein [Marinobacter sp.]MDX1634096.1 ATP-binding cassette domain-containing protein [Marinobacter sp.]
MPLLQLAGITASFGGERVLGPLSLSVNEGERVALVGRRGAGKSTLIRLLYQQSRGRVAMVPQDLGLVQALSVFHNVYMGRLNQHATWYNLLTLVRPFRRDREAIGPLLEQLAIEAKQWSPVASLSGGQRQRVAIARAVHSGAPILLADEPVSALDGPLAHVVMELLCETFSTGVIALHDVELALRYCDRIVGIQGGQIALDAPSSELTPADIQPLY